MAENLNSTHYADGIPLVDGTGVGDITGNYTTKYYFYYNNDSATYADTYGALYTWAAMMNGAASSNNNPSGVQGVCPDGWHIPSDTAWKELEMYLGMSQVEADKTVGWRGTDEGGKLKEIGTIHWDLKKSVQFTGIYSIQGLQMKVVLQPFRVAIVVTTKYSPSLEAMVTGGHLLRTMRLTHGSGGLITIIRE